MTDHTLIHSHITAASQAATDASQTYANPTIQAAIAQAHALTAIAILLDRMLTLAEDVVESAETDDDEPITERTQPLVYATDARIVGGEILH